MPGKLGSPSHPILMQLTTVTSYLIIGDSGPQPLMRIPTGTPLGLAPLETSCIFIDLRQRVSQLIDILGQNRVKNCSRSSSKILLNRGAMRTPRRVALMMSNR
jgi:hypothetical protein